MNNSLRCETVLLTQAICLQLTQFKRNGIRRPPKSALLFHEAREKSLFRGGITNLCDVLYYFGTSVTLQKWSFDAV